MSETRRYVSVEIVYEGDRCGDACPFLQEFYGNAKCGRFKKITDGDRCDECKAEDAHIFTVVPKDGTPEYKVTITPDIAQKIIREVKENGHD